MNIELENVSYFEALSPNLLIETVENQKRMSENPVSGPGFEIRISRVRNRSVNHSMATSGPIIWRRTVFSESEHKAQG
jgi:hypothetical protein